MMKKLLIFLLLVPAFALGQTVDYQPFANGGFANVETQAAYLADLANPAALQNGFQAGIAKSNQINKVIRQQAMVGAAMANAISQVNSQSVLDDGNLTALINFIIRMVQNSNSIWLSSVSGTNTVTAAVAPLAIAPAAYAAGGRWLIAPANTNTGAVTLNITGNVGGSATALGARNVMKPAPSGPVALAANDLVAGNVYQLVDDGTELVIIGARPYAQFTSIASAATLNLNNISGDYGHVTGSTTITAITLSQGESRTVVFDGSPILTNNASIILPTGSDIQTAAGDVATFRGESSGVVRVTAYSNSVQTFGTWTPTLGGTATYNLNSGSFTRTGRLVCIKARIFVALIGTGSTTNISGLPFVSSDDFYINVASVSSATAVVSAVGRVAGSSSIIILLSKTAASTLDTSNAMFGNSSDVSVSGCYTKI